MSVQNDARSLCELAAVLRDDHHKISVSTMGSHQILLNRIFSVHMGGGDLHLCAKTGIIGQKTLI